MYPHMCASMYACPHVVRHSLCVRVHVHMCMRVSVCVRMSVCGERVGMKTGHLEVGSCVGAEPSGAWQVLALQMRARGAVPGGCGEQDSAAQVFPGIPEFSCSPAPFPTTETLGLRNAAVLLCAL